MAALSLSPQELAELDEFLDSDAVPAGLWGVDVLHGFLTSVALSGTAIDPEQWLPLVWSTNREELPRFADRAQEKRLTAYILRMYDDIRATLADPDSGFSPLVTAAHGSGAPYGDGTLWCNGFMLGMVLLDTHWASFIATPTSSGLLLPILLLGSDTVPPDWEGMCETPEQRARLTEWIPAVVEAIHVQRFVLELIARKESRNALANAQHPCRCGSRKAFKACCGAPHRLH
ncbi:MAG: hypothetical protein H6R10_3023 [Rhodocyclaceae bacterium]|nr:hypothetical protein [Rhodocyclaceae bacterium]